MPPASRRVDGYVIVSATTVANRAEAEQRAAEAGKSRQRGLLAREVRPYAEAEGWHTKERHALDGGHMLWYHCLKSESAY